MVSYRFPGIDPQARGTLLAEALTRGRSAAQLVADFPSVAADGVPIGFAAGRSVLLQGLGDDISII